MLKKQFGKQTADLRQADKDEYIVIYVRDPDGLQQDSTKLINDCIKASNPDFVEYLAPHGFLAIFAVARGGHERSRMYLQRLNILLGR